jgi:hypothetical protein
LQYEIYQTGRLLHIRFKVHFRDFKQENGKSKSAQHLLENKHSTIPMEDIMEILQITRKNRMINTYERFYIYNEKMLDNQINDKFTVKPNEIFDAIIKTTPAENTCHCNFLHLI